MIDRLLVFKIRQIIASNKHIASIIKYMLLASVLVTASLYISHLHQVNIALEQSKAELEAELEAELKEFEAELATLENTEDYEIREMNITKYAPLDPGAVEGWDYAGDPKITASGKKVVPGESAAAGPNIPFGTRIYVEGKGWYTVKDRGGGIGVDDIDLAVEAKDESQAWGVQEKLVIIDKP